MTTEIFRGGWSRRPRLIRTLEPGHYFEIGDLYVVDHVEGETVVVHYSTGELIVYKDLSMNSVDGDNSVVLGPGESHTISRWLGFSKYTVSRLSGDT